MKRTVRKAHDVIYLKKDKQTKSQSTSCFLKPMNCKFYKLQLQKWMRCWWFYIHFPNLLRHRAFLLLVSWMTSTISPCVTGRSFAPGFFMMELGSTNMVCSTLSGPSYWETVTVVELKKIMKRAIPIAWVKNKQTSELIAMQMALCKVFKKVYLKFFFQILLHFGVYAEKYNMV